jgi:uncharacterized membrane protein
LQWLILLFPISSAAMNDFSPQEARLTEHARIIYILYLVSLAIGVTSIIGVVMAYVNKDDPMPEYLRTHYRYMINTFWMGMVMLLAGILLAIVVIGIFILLFLMVWLVVRCIKGLKLLDAQQPIPNPEGWGFN